MTELVYWVVEITLYYVALKSRRHALMVLAFSLPLSRRLPALPVPLLNYQNIIFGLVLLVCFRDMSKDKELAPSRGVRHWIPVGILALFFTIAYANTVLTFTPTFYPRLWDPYQNMISFRAAMLCLAMYALVSFFIRSREDLLSVVRAAVAGMSLEAAYTALEFLVLSPGRVSGHLAEPNSMGAFLAPSFALLFGLMILLPRTYPRWRALVGGTAVAAIGLLGTMSRGAWLAGLAGFGVVTTWVSRAALVVGIVVLALNSLWLPQKAVDRLDATFISKEDENWKFHGGRGTDQSALLSMVNEGVEEGLDAGGDTVLDTSLQSRLVIWEAAAKTMVDYPLGVGWGAFPWYVHYYTTVIRWKASHNMYLKIGTEAGPMTLVLFLGILVILCRDSFRAGMMKGDLEIRAFGVGMLGYIVALSVSALGVDVFFQVDVNGQFWCLAGAVSQAAFYPAAAEVRREEPGEAPRGARPLYELVR